MTFLATIVLALPLASFPPLTDSQMTRLDTAKDHGVTVDEAAFYALLENVADWSDEPPDPAGTWNADHHLLLDDPDDWRGRLCLVEGQLKSVMHPGPLSHAGWEKMRAWNLSTGDGHIVTVYLIDPPALTLRQEPRPGHFVPEQKDANVTVIARFYKLLDAESVGGQTRTYPIFVARTAHIGDAPAAVSATNDSGRFVPILGIIIVAAAVYFLVRIVMLGGRRKTSAPSQRPFEGRRPDADAVPDEARSDLPDDAAEAMDLLSRQQDEE